MKRAINIEIFPRNNAIAKNKIFLRNEEEIYRVKYLVNMIQKKKKYPNG